MRACVRAYIRTCVYMLRGCVCELVCVYARAFVLACVRFVFQVLTKRAKLTNAVKAIYYTHACTPAVWRQGVCSRPQRRTRAVLTVQAAGKQREHDDYASHLSRRQSRSLAESRSQVCARKTNAKQRRVHGHTRRRINPTKRPRHRPLG